MMNQTHSPSLALKRKEPVPLQDLYTCSPKAIWRHVQTEELGFWLICGYLLFEYVRPQTLYPALDFFPWASTLAVGALLMGILSKQQSPRGTPTGKLLVTYGFVVLLSSAFAIWPGLAFDQLRDYFQWVLIYYAIVFTVRTRHQFFIFLLLYLLCSYKMSQHGFLSWASRGFSFTNWGVTGSPGWFQNSGEFGIQLTIFTPLSIAFILALRSSWNLFAKVFFYAMPFTAIGSVLATSSRGALVGLAGTGLWALKSTKYFFRTVLALATIATIAWIAIPDEFASRFDTAGDDRTSVHRLDRWGKAWSTVERFPLLGVGHKNWDAYFRTYLDTGTPGSAKVHNIFLESATEHGLIGLAILVLILVSMFRVNARTRRHARENNMQFEYFITHGLDAAIVGMAISSTFITVLYYPYVWIHAALITCLHTSVVNAKLPQATAAPPRPEETNAPSSAPQLSRR